MIERTPIIRQVCNHHKMGPALEKSQHQPQAQMPGSGLVLGLAPAIFANSLRLGLITNRKIGASVASRAPHRLDYCLLTQSRIAAV